MEYKKIKRKNYTIHYINTDRFKTIDIVLCFTKYADKKENALNALLSNNLVYTSKKYNTKDKLVSASENLYNAEIGVDIDIIGKLLRLSFSLSILNPKYTEEDYFKDSLDYFNEIILNPNVKNDEFDNTSFEICKKSEINKINNIKNNSNSYASKRYSQIMYKNVPLEYGVHPEVEELDKVTPKKLYNHYKKLFTGEYKIDILLYGELDETMVDIVDRYYKNILGSSKKLELLCSPIIRKKPIVKIDSLKYNQSILKMGYNLVNFNYHELYHVLKVYNTILGRMNDSVLFNVVREQNSLCYSISSSLAMSSQVLTINSAINKTNYEKTVKLIKKCVKSMSDRKTVERLFDSAKQTLNTFLNNYYDDAYGQMSNIYMKEFNKVEDIEVLRKNINSVTIDEVIKLNEKINLSTIYFLKGDK